MQARISATFFGIVIVMGSFDQTLQAQSSAPYELSAEAVAAGIREGRFTAVELVESLLSRIDEHDHLNAFISVDRSGSLRRARAIDRSRQRGEPLGALAGVPIAVKDNINTASLPTTGGTPALSRFRPASNAPVLERLLSAGAIVIGKANMHELAFGITSDNAAFGTVRNAYDNDRLAGGSSGGTGAAIGARLVPAGLGSDTGGSIRIPAALNGIAGLRPTIGRYPGAGIVPISSTRDTAGPMARTISDLVLLDNVISGYDQPITASDLSGTRLGLPQQRFWDELEAETRAIAENVVAALRGAGATVIAVDAEPLVATIVDGDRTSALYEARRELTRFLQEFDTGITLEELAEQIASPDVRTIFEGVVDPAAVSADAYRHWMETQRPATQAAYRSIFARYELDALLFPTTPRPAVRVEEASEVRHNGRVVSTFATFVRNTSPATIAGLPGLSIPVGVTSEGLPVGIEIDGPPFADRRLLSIGLAIEALIGPVPAP